MGLIVEIALGIVLGVVLLAVLPSLIVFAAAVLVWAWARARVAWHRLHRTPYWFIATLLSSWLGFLGTIRLEQAGRPIAFGEWLLLWIGTTLIYAVYFAAGYLLYRLIRRLRRAPVKP